MDRIDINKQLFEKLVDKRTRLSENIKVDKKFVIDLDKQIGRILDLNTARTVECLDEFRVTRSEPKAPRKSIDPVKLIALGVPPSIIQQATVFGKEGKPGVVITKLRGSKEEAINDEEFGIDGDF